MKIALLFCRLFGHKMEPVTEPHLGGTLTWYRCKRCKHQLGFNGKTWEEIHSA